MPQTSSAVPPPADPVAPEYTAEIRFGVVMYGGVSLAIYINGVANELFEMACATPRAGVKLDDAGEPCTREVYRRLSWLAGNPELRAEYARALGQAREAGAEQVDPWSGLDRERYTQTRLAVDVIAGTSAGGINGVFLAKALANGEQFGALKDLWVNEGDVGLLLNDERSYSTTLPKLVDRSDSPTSLLNSDRMYAKLREAMGAMAALKVAAWPSSERGSPLVDEVDLFVTTTDIEGSAVPLRLFDKVVYERRYKQSYHFSYPSSVKSPAGNDFEPSNDSFLAFAARCTSSFPFAFEPMTLAAVARLKADGEPPGLKRWKPFFTDLPREEIEKDAHEHRAFGDGGYLDNKPFTYVVDTLSQRFSSMPMERKLVFVEPSPEQLDPHRLPDPHHPPDALQNSLAALTSIPRYETIREDLQSVLQRNRRIERVERMVRLGEIDIEKQVDPFAGVLNGKDGIPVWSSLKLSAMVRYYGLAFLPYQRLRVYSVTDGMSERLGERWGIDRESDLQYALRAVVQVWRERMFHDEGEDGRETINAFLDQFDLDYRLRRLGFLLRRIDQLIRLFRKRCAGPLDIEKGTADKPATLSEAEQQIVRRLPRPYTQLGPDLDHAQLEVGLRVLRRVKAGLIEVRAGLQEQARIEANALPPGTPAPTPELREELKAVLLLVLGQRTTGPAVRVSGANAAEQINVVLSPDALKLASVSRTLKEGVIFRASALLAAADSAHQKTDLQKALEAHLEAMRVQRSGTTLNASEPELSRISARAWALLGGPKLEVDDAAGGRAVVKIGDAVDSRSEFGLDGGALAALNSESGRALRQLLSDYYLRFDSFDQMSFPLYYDTGTGEPSTVEVVRISPVDATNLIDETSDLLHRRKLAGTALANFGAFLDRRWRLNDIMWGRLDGAERLIQALLPMTDPDTVAVRREFIETAHRGILREALVPTGHEDLADLLVKALNEVPGSGDTAQHIKDLLAQFSTGNAVARDRLGGVLASLLSERGLMDYVRSKREVDRDPDPEATLESAARAVTITGRVLESISTARDKGSLAPRWLARLGLMLQGIVAVSLPGTLKHRWWTHGMKVLYSFEAVALLFAFLFGSADIRGLVLTAFGVTLGVHLLTMVAGDATRKRTRWLHGAMVVVLVGLVTLATVGALALGHQGVQQALCWNHPTQVGGADMSARMCRWLGALR